jgi:hypothetical protein
MKCLKSFSYIATTLALSAAIAIPTAQGQNTHQGNAGNQEQAQADGQQSPQGAGQQNQDQQAQGQRGRRQQGQQAQGQQAQGRQGQQGQAQRGQAQQGQAQQGRGQAAQAGQAAQGGQQAQDQSQDGDRGRRRLKVIKLEQRDPQQLTQVMNLWSEVTQSSQLQAFPAQAAAAQQQQPQAKLAIAMDHEKKLLFVRGSEEQLDKIQSLIDAIDVKDDELESLDFAGHRLLPIHGENASQIQSMLGQLGLDGRVIRLGEASLIAYRTDGDAADDEKLEQAEEVINQLSGREKRSDKDRNDEANDKSSESDTEDDNADANGSSANDAG